MWAILANLIGGPIVTGLIGAYKAKLESGNTSERIAADLAARELAVQQREAEVNSSVVIAEQGRWYTACIRPLFCLPFIIFTLKVIVWDKVLKLGVTDPLDPNMWNVFMVIIGAYFGGRSIEKVARILKR